MEHVKQKKKKSIKKYIPLYIMISVPLIWYFVFCYIPMGGIIIAFKNYSLWLGIWDSPWVGFDHFKRFLSDEWFYMVLKNNLVLGGLNLLFNFTAPIILALLINEIRSQKFKRLTQSISYLPYFVSTVALVNIVLIMTSREGIVNSMITFFGSDPILFAAEPGWFRPMYIITLMWRGVGWGSIIYLATIAGISPELYDAAEIDGAGRLRKIWNVTIPGMLPVISIMLILAIPGILGADFETVLLMQQPITYSTSDVIPTYVFRRGFLGGSFSYGTAMGLSLSLVGIILILITNKISNKLSGNGIW